MLTYINVMDKDKTQIIFSFHWEVLQPYSWGVVQSTAALYLTHDPGSVGFTHLLPPPPIEEVYQHPKINTSTTQNKFWHVMFYIRSHEQKVGGGWRYIVPPSRLLLSLLSLPVSGSTPPPESNNQYQYRMACDVFILLPRHQGLS